MALSKVNFNSLNVTPAASKAVKFNSNNNGIETGDVGGSLVLLSTVTASSSSTVEFTSGIDSTYKEYQVHFNDVHPASDEQDFQVNFRDGSTAYDATKTTTFFQASQDEGGGSVGIEYRTGNDLAQATGFQTLNRGIANDNEHCVTGILHLFDPSSTTFVKHFIARTHGAQNGSPDAALSGFIAGYCNTTTAIDGIQFKFASGNIDAGTFKLYGVS